MGLKSGKVPFHKCTWYLVEPSCNRSLVALRHLTGHQKPHLGSSAWVKGMGAVKEQVLGEHELLVLATYLCFQGMLEYEFDTISIW